MSKKKSYSIQKVISHVLATRSDSDISYLTQYSDNENLASKTVNDGGEIESKTDKSK